MGCLVPAPLPSRDQGQYSCVEKANKGIDGKHEQEQRERQNHARKGEEQRLLHHGEKSEGQVQDVSSRASPSAGGQRTAGPRCPVGPILVTPYEEDIPAISRDLHQHALCAVTAHEIG